MILLEAKAVIVQNTISMHSMHNARGSGGMPPQENFEK